MSSLITKGFGVNNSSFITNGLGMSLEYIVESSIRSAGLRLKGGTKSVKKNENEYVISAALVETNGSDFIHQIKNKIFETTKLDKTLNLNITHLNVKSTKPDHLVVHVRFVKKS